MTYATALAVGPREENQSVGRKLIALVTVTTVELESFEDALRIQ
jgi:hypothetical protein